MSKAFWHEVDGREATVQEAVGAWSMAAWWILEDVAARWKRTLTEEQLGYAVQKRSGVRTDLPVETWIGPVISLVAQRAHESKGVRLTCFITREDGHVPDSYKEVLALEGVQDPSPRMLQDHSLEQRMLGHRAYGATIPPHGVLPRKRIPAEPKKTTLSVLMPEEKARPVCQRCFIELPASGQCDWCD